MPFQKGNIVGQENRWGKGQVANPAGRPPDKLRRFIHAELDKIGREATDKKEAAEHGFFTESCQTEMRRESGAGPVRLVQESSSV